METAQHWDSLAKIQPAEIAMFQISEVQESPAFNGRRSFLTLRQRLDVSSLCWMASIGTKNTHHRKEVEAMCL